MAIIAFAGTPEFAVPSLAALIDTGHEIAPVLTQPDRPAGRGRRITASPVKRLALEHGLNVLQPDKLKPELLEAIPARPALMVVVAYGLLIPQWLLDWPERGCVNVHASLLPRWRGAAPIQRAVLAGDEQTGVCLMAMTRGLDTGPVYARVTTDVGRRSAGELHAVLARQGAGLLALHLENLLAGRLAAEPQSGSPSYAHKLAKDEAILDWTASAEQLDCQVRGLNPWPIAETRWGERRLRIHAARPLAMPSAASDPVPGSVVAAGSEGIDVATGAGVLRIEVLQLPGAKPLSAAQFINAHDLTGATLG